MRGLPGVADAAVVPQGDPAAPSLIRFIVPAPEGRTAEADSTLARRVRIALAGTLPLQLVPAQVHVVPAIPLLPSLKPDLAALQALLSAERKPRSLGGLRALVRSAGRRALSRRVS